MTRPTLKASEAGKQRIDQAKNRKAWTIESESPLIEASRHLQPGIDWQQQDSYAKYVSQATWKRFLSGRDRIRAEVFKAFCLALELDWQEVVDLAIRNPHGATQRDLAEAPDRTALHGRTEELAKLQHWLLSEKRRLIWLHGQAEIGKTVLARQLVETVASQFQLVVWRSLDYSQSFAEFAANLLKGLAADPANAQILPQLHQHRCLIVIDDWQTMLEREELGDRSDERKYEKLLERIALEAHQSSVLLISQTPPKAQIQAAVLQLRGLSAAEAKQLLRAEGLKGSAIELEEFSQRYRHPWVLKQIAKPIREEWDGEIKDFLDTLLLGDPVTDFLNEQLRRLTPVEMQVLYWIALHREPLSRDQLMQDAASCLKVPALVNALNLLRTGRSLIDRDELGFYSLEPVLLKHLTQQFVETCVQAFLQAIVNIPLRGTEPFLTHAWVTANFQDEELKREQIQRIVLPIQTKLLAAYGDRTPLLEKVRLIEAALGTVPIGYGRENLEWLRSGLDELTDLSLPRFA
jgi:hypothetical protein